MRAEMFLEGWDTPLTTEEVAYRVNEVGELLRSNKAGQDENWTKR